MTLFNGVTPFALQGGFPVLMVSDVLIPKIIQDGLRNGNIDLSITHRKPLSFQR
jgi:hypothetical protein